VRFEGNNHTQSGRVGEDALARIASDKLRRQSDTRPIATRTTSGDEKALFEAASGQWGVRRAAASLPARCSRRNWISTTGLQSACGHAVARPMILASAMGELEDPVGTEQALQARRQF